MKITALFCLLILATACSEEPKKVTPKESEESLEEYKNGVYTMYYPGKKKIKIQGMRDVKKVRDGKWILLSPNGTELSYTYFEKGKREGHSFVKYPNGAMHYHGEYLHDKQVGIWKFYDEKGKLTKEEDHGTGAAE